MHHFHINQQDEIKARFFNTPLSFLEFHLKLAKFSWLIQIQIRFFFFFKVKKKSEQLVIIRPLSSYTVGCTYETLTTSVNYAKGKT